MYSLNFGEQMISPIAKMNIARHAIPPDIVIPDNTKPTTEMTIPSTNDVIMRKREKIADNGNTNRIIAAESILMIISGLSAPSSRNFKTNFVAQPRASIPMPPGSIAFFSVSALVPSRAIAPLKSASPTPRRSTHSLRKLGNKSQSCMNISQNPDTMSKKHNIGLSFHSVRIVPLNTDAIESLACFAFSFSLRSGSLKKHNVNMRLTVVTNAALKNT